MMLHYAYIRDPVRHEFDSSSESSGDDEADIKTEADASSVVHADGFN